MQAVWMLFSSFMFASMGVCVKFASAHFNSAELVCYRGILGMIFMYVLVRARGNSRRTPRARAGKFPQSRLHLPAVRGKISP